MFMVAEAFIFLFRQSLYLEQTRKEKKTKKQRKIALLKHSTHKISSSPEILSNLGQIENDNVYAFYYVFMLIFTPRFMDFEPMNRSENACA